MPGTAYLLMPAPDAIHDGDRNATLTAIGEQASELHGVDRIPITCPCGTTLPLREAFRCLYCEVYWCPSCAEDHFD